MRCRTCLSTGFTLDELIAHEKKSGHKRGTDSADWQSGDEFFHSPPPAAKIPVDALVAALTELGVDPKILQDAIAAKKGATA